MSEKLGRTLVAELAAFCIIFALVAAFLGYIGHSIGKKELAQPVISVSRREKRIVLDAGHGGDDGGATGINGRLEKELNLELCEKLEAYLKLFDFDVVMTRREDISHGESASRGKRKMADLARRLELAHELPDALFLSIHMNKFPQEVCRGLQVWYSPNDEKSMRLAQIISSTVKSELQRENTREIKRADSSIYLLDRMKNTSVLVECGFISNREECEKLCDAEYQKMLAASIAHALTDFYDDVG